MSYIGKVVRFDAKIPKFNCDEAPFNVIMVAPKRYEIRVENIYNMNSDDTHLIFSQLLSDTPFI